MGDIYEAFALSALALGTTPLVWCVSSGIEQQGRSDPFEGLNRTMYNFNFNVCWTRMRCSVGRGRPGVIKRSTARA
ncbi:hypothetical protein KCP77_09640 [Salmonella enterica subsp. enterica]|nr:hypothetical protein KCP77_09640 [Salmonella enterica subsp. enterica]